MLGNINNFDFSYDSDSESNSNIREPIPIVSMKLVNDIEYLENTFNEFKQKILSDKNMDANMKKIIIHTRSEYINNLKNQIKESEKINKNSLLFSMFKEELDKKASESKIYYNYKIILENKIIDWICDKINNITMEFEMCWDIIELINNLNVESNIKLQLLDIFKPSNLEEFNNYVQIIEISKNEFEKTRLDKIKLNEIIQNAIKLEEDKQNKINEINQIEKNKRINILEIIIFNLKKILVFDKSIDKLKTDLEKPFDDFKNLSSDNIILNHQIHQDFLKFINSIRINKDNKEILLNYCIILEK